MLNYEMLKKMSDAELGYLRSDAARNFAIYSEIPSEARTWQQNNVMMIWQSVHKEIDRMIDERVQEYDSEMSANES